VILELKSKVRKLELENEGLKRDIDYKNNMYSDLL